MNYTPISIISEIDGDRQIWTFYIEESDLIAIMEKYEACGFSTRGNVMDIMEEVSEVWKEEERKNEQ